MILHFSNICHDNDGHTEHAQSQRRHFFPMINDQHICTYHVHHNTFCVFFLLGNACHLHYEIMAVESHSAKGFVFVVGSDNTTLTLGHSGCQTDQTVV